jgi:hypothetical protein
MDFYADLLGTIILCWIFMNLVHVVLNTLTKYKLHTLLLYGISYVVLFIFVSVVATWLDDYQRGLYIIGGIILYIWYICKSIFNAYRYGKIECPYCKEKVKSAAVICKHCKSNLQDQTVSV